MNDLDSRCLDRFPEWLRTLGDDATLLASVIDDPAAPESVRRYAAGALNYLFKSLDLISDGIEDLGFLDDAFVVRVAAALALGESPEAGAQTATLKALADDAKLIESMLDSVYPRLESYVMRLRTGTARGRTVDEILADEVIRRDFLNEVAGWASSYETPTFTRDEKNLVKLKSFLTTQLP